MLIILRDFVLFVIEVLVGFERFKPERGGEGGGDILSQPRS